MHLNFWRMNTPEVFDFITIGAGCAGASAAMYATRLNMKTAMIGEMPGGLITTTQDVENWPGIKKISGPDLGLAVFEHATSFGAKFFNEKVTDIEKADIGHHLHLSSRLVDFTDQAFTQEEIEDWVRSLPETVYRMKGYLPIKGNSKPMLFQYAYGLTQWMPEFIKMPPKLVIIGDGVDAIPLPTTTL